MKSIRFLLLPLLALLFALPAAGESDLYTEMPPYLRFSQETIKETIEEGVRILRTYPDTVNDQVDADMRALIDSMVQTNCDRLSPPTGRECSRSSKP